MLSCSVLGARKSRDREERGLDDQKNLTRAGPVLGAERAGPGSV